MQIEAEHGFPEWSEPTEISVQVDLPGTPATGEGIYLHILSLSSV